jgi:hypothetical protein
MSSTEEKKSVKIKKVGEVWLTEETLEKNFPKNCVVNCDVIEMELKSDFPILLRQKSKVHYEVFSTSRERYRNTLNKIMQKNEEIEMEEKKSIYIPKKVKCLHCSEEIEGHPLSSEGKSCKCGKVAMCAATIVEGVLGKDYVDISAKLLNENA